MLYSTRMDRGGDPGHVTELVGAFEKRLLDTGWTRKLICFLFLQYHFL